MNNLLSFTPFVGNKITVRDVLPLLRNACHDGVEDFFSSILPQQEGQHPLDREFFICKNSYWRVTWVIGNLCDPRNVNVNAYEFLSRIRNEIDLSSLPDPIYLDHSDPLYPLMMYMTHSIGNVIEPNQVDYSHASNFCNADCTIHDQRLFTDQFSRLDILGVSVHVPVRCLTINFKDKNDWGKFEFGDVAYRFRNPSNKTKSARFDCDIKRHKVVDLYVSKFFEIRNQVELALISTPNNQSDNNGGVK